jgi:hypothetical protein
MRRSILKVTIGSLQGVFNPFGGFLGFTFLISKSSESNTTPDFPQREEGGLT